MKIHPDSLRNANPLGFISNAVSRAKWSRLTAEPQQRVQLNQSAFATPHS